MRGCGELLERPLLRREIEADRLGHPLVAMGIVVMGKISSGMMTPRSSVDSVVAYEGVSREFFTTHLRWQASLLVRVRGQAQTQFYRALSRCKSGFLEIEAAFWC